MAQNSLKYSEDATSLEYKLDSFSSVAPPVSEHLCLEREIPEEEIVSKWTRVAVNGSKLLKVYVLYCIVVDSEDATSLEYKLDSFSSVAPLVSERLCLKEREIPQGG
ncbi:hypothetical protein B0H11DRAFT_1915482 [Mycena galericulata]|nr:hypothetical protein B0H11DRAFT_1915482 [Mycena galericulata]